MGGARRGARQARAGTRWRPTCPGYGDSPPDPPHTWQRMVDAVERFHAQRAGWPRRAVRPRLGRAHRPALGLRPPRERARARHQRHRLLPRRQVARPGQGDAHRGRGRGDRRRHDARGLRPDARRGRAGHRRAVVRRVLQGLRRPVRRRGQLELYRSGDFAELERYRGRLAALGVPTLLLFGSEDPFAPRRHAPIAWRRRSRTRAPRSSTASGTSCSTRCPSAPRRSSWTSCASGLTAATSNSGRRRWVWRPGNARSNEEGITCRGTRRLAWAAAAVCALSIGAIAPAASAASE